jgi:hypothetical protein
MNRLFCKSYFCNKLFHKRYYCNSFFCNPSVNNRYLRSWSFHNATGLSTDGCSTTGLSIAVILIPMGLHRKWFLFLSWSLPHLPTLHHPNVSIFDIVLDHKLLVKHNNKRFVISDVLHLACTTTALTMKSTLVPHC